MSRDFDEISIREVFILMYMHKLSVIAIFTFFLIGSIVYVLNKQDIYQSEVLLAPVTDSVSGGGGGLAGKLGGLASIAGVGLGKVNEIDKTAMAIEILKSRQFSTVFIEKHQILPELMAVRKWNAEENKLIFDDELYNESTKTWVREVNFPLQPKPSTQEAFKVFSEILNVELSIDTGLVKISIRHNSPYIAKLWVDLVVQDINLYMKNKEVQEALQSQKFLKTQLSKTEVEGLRVVIYGLIEEQIKKIMFAEVRDEYVFKVLDPALVMEEKNGPKRLLIVIFVSFIGLLVGILFTLFKVYISRFKAS